MRFILALIILYTVSSASAQEMPGRLLLMNGKELDVFSFNDTSYTDLRFRYDKNYFRRERRDIEARRRADRCFDLTIQAPASAKIPIVIQAGKFDRSEVFAYTSPGGVEKVYYYYEPETGNDYSVDATRAYVLGARDARVTRKGMGWFYAGLATGFAGGYLTEGSVWALAVPPLFSLTTLIPRVSIPERSIHNLTYQYNDDYAAGFEKQARSRNLRQALKGSVLGTALGLSTWFILDNNR